ncbi:MAG: GNAT family N-acetyltransferase [Faecousia sp.]
MKPDIPALRGLWKEAFGDEDAFLDDFFTAAFSPRRMRAITENGQLKAALYWFDCGCRGKKIAYLYAVATAKAFRGRGLCRRLMEDTHHCLRQQGYAGAVLVPGERSLLEMYAGMGYRAFSGISEFLCTAQPGNLALTRISGEDYARLRRGLVPPGSVLQEGENLAFLQTQFDLFAGENLLLAAKKEGNALLCAELLGDSAAAPEILDALGCDRGTFRTPGSGRSFAMYHPFTEDPAPAYFGLAFD